MPNDITGAFLPAFLPPGALADPPSNANADVHLMTVPGLHHVFYADDPEVHVGTAIEFLARILKAPSPALGTK